MKMLTCDYCYLSVVIIVLLTEPEYLNTGSCYRFILLLVTRDYHLTDDICHKFLSDIYQKLLSDY